MPAQLKRRLFIFLTVIGVIAAALFGHWLLIGRHLESTDNAYVQGEITRVSSQLGARIEQCWCRTISTLKRRVAIGAGAPILSWPSNALSPPWRPAKPNSARRAALDQQASLIAASRADVSASEAALGARR